MLTPKGMKTKSPSMTEESNGYDREYRLQGDLAR